MRPLFFGLRSVVASFLFVVVTLGLSLSAFVSSFFTSPQSRVSRLHIKWWGLITCFLFSVKVRVIGKGKWPSQSGGVVLFNHTSFFDIFAMAGFLPDMRFGAKIELFKIPIFGAAMRRLGILPIDRGRREKVFEIYKQSVERLSAGEKIALAPEGTRTSSPRHLMSFKSGPFLFALQSKVSVIPVVIKGAYEILPKGHWLPQSERWSSVIELVVLDPIPTQDLGEGAKEKLQNQVKSLMQKELASEPSKSQALALE